MCIFATDLERAGHSVLFRLNLNGGRTFCSPLTPFLPGGVCRHRGEQTPLLHPLSVNIAAPRCQRREKKESPPQIKKPEDQAVESERELCAAKGGMGAIPGPSPQPPQWGHQAGTTARWLRARSTNTGDNSKPSLGTEMVFPAKAQVP